MLLNITFSNGPTSIQEDLRNHLLTFLMKNQTPKKEGKDMLLAPLYLFKDKEVNPSPALRCILLGIILRGRYELESNQIVYSYIEIKHLSFIIEVLEIVVLITPLFIVLRVYLIYCKCA